MDKFDDAIEKYEAKIKQLKQDKKEAELKANAPIGKAARKVFGNDVPDKYREAVTFFENILEEITLTEDNELGVEDVVINEIPKEKQDIDKY